MTTPWLVSNIHILDLLSRPCQGGPRFLPNLNRTAREGRPMLEALMEPRRALVLAGAYRRLAERALAGAALDADEGRVVLGAPDDELAQLLWAAYAVRSRHFGRRVKLCVLNNARSGLCPEDCGYCSQSAVSTADIARYRRKPVAELVAAARRAVASGARRYCMVTSARGQIGRAHV